jgi:hypothetical protein
MGHAPHVRAGHGRRRRRSFRGAGWLALLAVIALAIAAPVAVLASGGAPGGPARVDPLAPAPGESCSDATQGPDPSDVCRDVTGPDSPGTGGIDLGGLLPVLGAALGGAGIALVAALIFVRRRPVAPAAPADPGEWWTCRSCGKTNVLGSARCYACGTWQG